MVINVRIKKIERTLQDHILIPNSEKAVVIWPEDTAEEKEVKLKNLHEELKRKYGDDVSRQDIITMNVIYDGPTDSRSEER
jgi:hypothetical protein